MLRKEGAPSEGLHQEVSEVAGAESAEHAPGLAAGSPHLIPLGGGARGSAGRNTLNSAGRALNTSANSSSAACGENQSDNGSDLDPHICKEWPCPHCHKPRDVDDEMVPGAGQYSAEAARIQSFFHPQEPLKLEQSDDSDDD